MESVAGIYGAGVLLGILWTAGLLALWRQRAWKALTAFVVLMVLGSVMTLALAAGLEVLPWSRWVTAIFEPLARLLFGTTVQ